MVGGAATALLLLLLLLLLQVLESDTVGFETDFSSLARSPKGEGPTQAECMNVCRARGGVLQKRNRILVVLHKRCASTGQPPRPHEFVRLGRPCSWTAPTCFQFV